MMEKKLFYLLLFLAATGFAAGVFYEIYVSGDGKTQLMELLSAIFDAEDNFMSLLGAAVHNFCSGLPFLLCAFFMTWFPFLVMMFMILLFFQNFIYGISAALLMETFGLSEGLLHVMTATALPVLLRTMFFICFAVSIIKSWKYRSGNRISGRKKALRILTEPDAVKFAAAAAALLFISLLQAILQQAMF